MNVITLFQKSAKLILNIYIYNLIHGKITITKTKDKIIFKNK